MKLLLIGKPRIGKTSLIKGFIDGIDDKQGFVTNEIRAAEERVGFEVVSSTGQTTILASIDSPSMIRVARYGVETEPFDTFVRSLPTPQPHKTIYVDEIGEMQLQSENFRSYVTRCLYIDVFFIGAITSIYRDAFVDTILARDDIVLIEVTTDNLREIKNIIDALAINLAAYKSLGIATRIQVSQMAQSYTATSQYTQLKKLFSHAVRYIAENHIDQQSLTTYIVHGDHKDHVVSVEANSMICDCDLFRGVGYYIDTPGECSHIQAVKLTI